MWREGRLTHTNTHTYLFLHITQLQSLQNKIDDLKASLDDADTLTGVRIRNKIESYQQEMRFIRTFPKSIGEYTRPTHTHTHAYIPSMDWIARIVSLSESATDTMCVTPSAPLLSNTIQYTILYTILHYTTPTAKASSSSSSNSSASRRQTYSGSSSDSGSGSRSGGDGSLLHSFGGSRESPRFTSIQNSSNRRNSITKSYPSKQRWSLPSSLDALDISSRRWSSTSTDSNTSNMELWTGDPQQITAAAAEDMQRTSFDRDHLQQQLLQQQRPLQTRQYPRLQDSYTQPLGAPIMSSTPEIIKQHKRRSFTAQTLKEYQDSTLPLHALRKHPYADVIPHPTPEYLLMQQPPPPPPPSSQQQQPQLRYRYSSGETLMHQSHNYYHHHNPQYHYPQHQFGQGLHHHHHLPPPTANPYSPVLSPPPSPNSIGMAFSPPMHRKAQRPSSGAGLEQFSLTSANFTNFVGIEHQPLIAPPIEQPPASHQRPQTSQTHLQASTTARQPSLPSKQMDSPARAEESDVDMAESPLSSASSSGMRQHSIHLFPMPGDSQQQQQPSPTGGYHPPTLSAFVPLNDQVHRPQAVRSYSMGSIPISNQCPTSHTGALPASPMPPQPQSAPPSGTEKKLSFVERLFLRKIPIVLVKKNRKQQ